MAATFEKIPTKCKTHGTPLVRITEPEFDRVFCPVCYAFGEYEEVVEQGAGLTPRNVGMIDEETMKLVDEAWQKLQGF